MITYEILVERKSFWDEGVVRQIRAYNFGQAAKQFDKSCMLCCMRNMRMDCDACPIRAAFNVNKGIFKVRGRKPED